MRKMRLSLCLLSALARGWVTALFGAAGGAVPTRTWQEKPGGQGEGGRGSGKRRDVAAGPCRSAVARSRRTLPSPSLSSRTRPRPGWCRQNEDVFCLGFLASPQQCCQPRLPPSSCLPQPTAAPLLQSARPRCQGSEEIRPKTPPWHPNYPQHATLGGGCSQPPSMAGGLLFVRGVFLSLFDFLPPIGSLSRWVCVFLFKHPPPPVVLKPGRREPRAHFCLDVGSGNGGARREERDGRAGKGGRGGGKK